MIRVTDVKHLGGHRLSFRFSDGTSGEADLTDHLTHAHAALLDERKFHKAFVDGGTVCWPGDLDLAPDYLYALAHGLAPPRTLDDAEANELEVTLAELRRLAGKTQVDVAALLGVGQGDVSRMERRGDARLSTLRRYVEALGGELEIVARIGSKSVVIRGV